MSWFKKLNKAFKKSSTKLTESITQVFTHKKLDEKTLETFEETLITSDMGIKTAQILSEKLRKSRFGKEVTQEEIKSFLAREIETLLTPRTKVLDLTSYPKPAVILMVGVNGSGKTTSIAKLCAKWQQQGKHILIAAADTFRAAATEQLETWANRLKLPLYKKTHGADAASLAYEAYQKALKENFDILVIDTAGRLQNNNALMAELEKINRVLKKVNPETPHEIILVLDGTTGQNAVQQVEHFSTILPLTGLIMTKLDGTAKGGILVQIAQKFEIPIYAIGIGETFDDLNTFNAKEFAMSLTETSHPKASAQTSEL
jgi:fused signal recognition particle receptor